MRHHPKEITPGVGAVWARIGAGALKLILSGVSARAHAMAGSRPSSQHIQSLSLVSAEGRERL